MKFADDMDAILFLEKQGYTLTRKFCWVLPKDLHKPTEDEDRALSFLFNEWDYGGVIGTDIVTEKRNESFPTTPVSPGGVDSDNREAGSGPSGRDLNAGVQPDPRPTDNGDSTSASLQPSGATWDAFPKVG
jgi:hypothetical protein